MKIKYLVVTLPSKAIESRAELVELLDRYGSQGWILTTSVIQTQAQYGWLSTPRQNMIFMRDTDNITPPEIL